MTKIEWTDETINFWWGCTKVGPGCDFCYAETWDHRLGGAHWGQGVPRRKIKGAIDAIHKLNRRAGKNGADIHVFIQSMSDLFDLEVPDWWFAEAWAHIHDCDRLSIQILTKRVSAVEKRLRQTVAAWPEHAGLMITVVNQAEADRDIPRLLALKESFDIPWVGLSCEPLIGPIDLTHWLDRLDWVIVGGESGPRARPMHKKWATSLCDQCQAATVLFFFKQWGEWAPQIGAINLPDDPERSRYTWAEWTDWGGGAPRWEVSERPLWCDDMDPDHCMVRVGKKAAGALLDGRGWREMPS